MLSSQPTNELLYTVAFAFINGIGPRTIARLKTRFGNLEASWQAPAEELAKILPPRAVRLIISQRLQLNPSQCWERVQALELQVIRPEQPDYPPLLKNISDPPFVLFVRGNARILQQNCLSAVGTRRASDYGRSVVQTLIPPLAEAGYTIVSGLALGIDSLVHQAALAKGKTVAVLAHGLDYIHPAVNTDLAHAIVVRGGCLVSEYPPGIAPERWRFPHRNRIIAGLSEKTLVIEAPERSGALITARLALDENRDVLAVPGSIFAETSVGTNQLLARGAQVVTNAADITGQAPETAVALDTSDLSATAKTIFDAVPTTPLHIDNIAAACNFDPSVVGAELAYLELRGLVTHVGGQRYRRQR